MLPLVDEAVQSLKLLKKADLEEIRSMSRPPEGVRLTMEAVCIMFGKKPASTKSGGAYGGGYWETAQRELLNNPTGLLQDLMSYDRDHIPEKRIVLIKKYIDMPEFQPEVIDRVNRASTAICLWVRAMVKYDEVMQVVKPKKLILEEAQAALDETQIKLNTAKRALQGVQDTLYKLREEAAAAQARKQSLSEEEEQCSRRLQRAEALMGGLGGSAERWREESLNRHWQRWRLIGDGLVCAATIAYLGPFPGDYRVDLGLRWQRYLDRLNIPNSGFPRVRPVHVLGNEGLLREWRLKGLPQDDVSAENAIIMRYTPKWPLFIDPQRQCIKFLATLGKEFEVRHKSLDPWTRKPRKPHSAPRAISPGAPRSSAAAGVALRNPYEGRVLTW